MLAPLLACSALASPACKPDAYISYCVHCGRSTRRIPTETELGRYAAHLHACLNKCLRLETFGEHPRHLPLPHDVEWRPDEACCHHSYNCAPRTQAAASPPLGSGDIRRHARGEGFQIDDVAS